jgi:limonene 1,2-monooxygenase
MNSPPNFGVFVTPFHPTGQSPTVAVEYDMEPVGEQQSESSRR